MQKFSVLTAVAQNMNTEQIVEAVSSGNRV